MDQNNNFPQYLGGELWGDPPPPSESERIWGCLINLAYNIIALIIIISPLIATLWWISR